MASKLAETIATRINSREFDQVDDELSGVRECLEGLRNLDRCWCHGLYPNAMAHSPACLAAQEVWKSLEVK